LHSIDIVNVRANQGYRLEKAHLCPLAFYELLPRAEPGATNGSPLTGLLAGGRIAGKRLTTYLPDQ